MTEAIIQVTNLRKSFKQSQAVKNISFKVERGSLFAFLGTNGAGKSTTISMLCTLIEADSGEIIIAGIPLKSIKDKHTVRSRVGIVPQKSVLDGQLTVRENLWHRGHLYGLTKAQFNDNYNFVTSYLNLQDIEDKRYGKLSGGQRRRADIARALIHKPSILFLDEPTTGLDPHTRIFVWEAIRRLQMESDMTIFLTTHYMEEAAVADQIVVIKEGAHIAEGTPNELKDRYAKDRVCIVLQNSVDLRAIERLIPENYHKRGEVIEFNIPSTLHALPILEKLTPHIQSFEVVKGSMDDVFIQLNEGGGPDAGTAPFNSAK